MASVISSNSVAGDMLAFWALISKAYPNYKRMNINNLFNRMVSDGVIQADALLEQAVSVQGKLKRDSRKGRDHVDGSDCKKTTTQWAIEPGVTPRRRAVVRNLEHKRGVLRVMVNETISGKIFYFKIPRRAYVNKQRICIYFTQDGQPKRESKWWDWEVSSFKEFSS